MDRQWSEEKKKRRRTDKTLLELHEKQGVDYYIRSKVHNGKIGYTMIA